MEITMDFQPKVFHTESNCLIVSIDFIDFVHSNKNVKINVIKHLRHLAKQTLYSIGMVQAKNIIEFIYENDIHNMQGKTFPAQIRDEFIDVVFINYNGQLCIKFNFSLSKEFDYYIDNIFQDYLRSKYSIKQTAYDNYIVAIDTLYELVNLTDEQREKIVLERCNSCLSLLQFIKALNRFCKIPQLDVFIKHFYGNITSLQFLTVIELSQVSISGNYEEDVLSESPVFVYTDL